MLLVVNDVRKSFGGVKALRGVSFNVEEGEMVGLVGPNGAGKTTLFNVIAGVYKPDTGTVIYDNKDITGLPPHEIIKRGISRTFQVVRLFDNMSVIDNIALPLLFVKGTSLKNAREAALEFIELVGLKGKEYTPIGSLTLQEKRRVELARALVTRPRLVLIDEIAAGLRPKELLKVEDTIRRINKEYMMTVIWVEHHFHSVAKTCHRIIFLDQGRIIIDDKPEVVAKDPRVIKTYVGEEGGSTSSI